MGRLAKLKRENIEMANKRLLGEHIDKDTDGDGIPDRSDYFPDIDSGYIARFGADDDETATPWMNRQNRRFPNIDYDPEDYGDEETFDTVEDWKESGYYKDPSNRWDIINRRQKDDEISRPSYGDAESSAKGYFDKYRERFGPFRVKKLRQGAKPLDDEDDVESGFGDVSVMSNRNYYGEDLYGLPGSHISDEEAEESVRDGRITQDQLDTWRERKDWSEEESKAWKDSQG